VAREKKRLERREGLKERFPRDKVGMLFNPERPLKSMVIKDYFWLRARLRSEILNYSVSDLATAFDGYPFPRPIFM
jgi:hypothetical protein